MRASSWGKVNSKRSNKKTTTKKEKDDEQEAENVNANAELLSIPCGHERKNDDRPIDAGIRAVNNAIS